MQIGWSQPTRLRPGGDGAGRGLDAHARYLWITVTGVGSAPRATNLAVRGRRGIVTLVASGAVLALLPLAAIGCATAATPTTAGSSSTPSGFPTASPIPASTVVPSSAATSSLSGPPVSATSLPDCATADLSIKIGQSSRAGGSDYALIQITNISSAPCSTGGYFRLSLLNGSGGVEPLSVERAPGLYPASSPLANFTLSPGGVAGFLLEWVQGPYDPAGNACPVATEMRLTPPSAVNPTDLPALTADGIAITPCGDGVSIGPLALGPFS